MNLAIFLAAVGSYLSSNSKSKYEDQYSKERKFLQVLLHQMPQKLQTALAEILLLEVRPKVKRGKLSSFLPPSKREISLFEELFHVTDTQDTQYFVMATEPEYRKKQIVSLYEFVDSALSQRGAWHGEDWSWQWAEDCAIQAQHSLERCWKLIKDLGLSSYVSYRYFDSCYRNGHDCLERESRGELCIILKSDDAYPKALLALRQPPRLLFWQGQLLESNAEATTIVGTRRADHWGLWQAWQEALLLQKRNNPLGSEIGELAELVPASQTHWIVSGLAKGCDIAAHRGAIDAGSPTLAVLPGGFDRIYPKYHRSLAQRIVAGGGALVSEYVPQAAPLKWRFIQRDRLQAALARRLLLIQSDLNGGSMYAVQAALEIGRPVYVLDGQEICWHITPSCQKQGFAGALRLKQNLRQFSQVKQIMNANYALLDKQLVEKWSCFTQSCMPNMPKENSRDLPGIL